MTLYSPGVCGASKVSSHERRLVEPRHQRTRPTSALCVTWGAGGDGAVESEVNGELRAV